MQLAPTVGILRHQQFLPSETFIRSQALALRDFRPLFIGREPILTRGVDSLSVSQFGRPAMLSYLLTRRSARLRTVLADRRVALLHAHFGVEGVYAVHTAKALSLPLVTTLHGFDVTIRKPQLLLTRKPSLVNYVASRRALFDGGTVFICVSEFLRGRAIEWGYPAERVVVLPIGVDVEAIQPTGVVSTPRIVHIARLVEVKGTAYLLKAFATVRTAVPDAELVIVGDGPLRASLAALARQLGIAQAVRFMGAQRHSETLHQLSQARVLCLPSVRTSSGAEEGLGMVLLEAAAAGRPVVGTNCGGIPEAVTDGLNGFLAPQRDVAALADRLLELLRDQQLCEQFGKAGRELVRERFNLRSQTGKLESLYRTLT